MHTRTRAHKAAQTFMHTRNYALFYAYEIKTYAQTHMRTRVAYSRVRLLVCTGRNHRNLIAHLASKLHREMAQATQAYHSNMRTRAVRKR